MSGNEIMQQMWLQKLLSKFHSQSWLAVNHKMTANPRKRPIATEYIRMQVSLNHDRLSITKWQPTPEILSQSYAKPYVEKLFSHNTPLKFAAKLHQTISREVVQSLDNFEVCPNAMPNHKYRSHKTPLNFATKLRQTISREAVQS